MSLQSANWNEATQVCREFTRLEMSTKLILPFCMLTWNNIPVVSYYAPLLFSSKARSDIQDRSESTAKMQLPCTWLPWQSLHYLNHFCFSSLEWHKNVRTPEVYVTVFSRAAQEVLCFCKFSEAVHSFGPKLFKQFRIPSPNWLNITVKSTIYQVCIVILLSTSPNARVLSSIVSRTMKLETRKLLYWLMP